MKKLVTLFLFVGCMSILLGCCSDENSYLYITVDDFPESKNVIVDRRGQFPAPVTFSSGDDSIDTTEDNTLKENVVVNITKTKTYDTGRNAIGNPDFIYLYGVTAELIDSLGHRTEVHSLEKPLKLTLPTAHLGSEGICFVGLREKGSNSSWKFSRVSDNGSVFLDQRSIRAAKSEKLSPNYDFMLYKMGVELALFVYNKPPESAEKVIASTGIVSSATALLALDEAGKYLNDLIMYIKLAGENLAQLDRSDIDVSITYRTSKPEPSLINSKGVKCEQKSEKNNDAAVTGDNSYVHTLKVSQFDVSSVGETEINFTLDLQGMKKSDFPTDFLLEVSSKEGAGGDKNLIPFSYLNKINSEKPIEYYNISYNLDGGSLADGDINPVKYSSVSETFVLKNPVKAGFTFEGWTGTDLNEATKIVTVEKGSIGNRYYNAIWKENTPGAFTLAVEKGTGFVSVSDGGSYEAGSEITLEYALETGYQFVSWTSDSVVVDESNKFTMPAKDVTVKANAGIITYNISYDGLDGAGVINPVTYDVSSDTITLHNPTKDNYTFKGWSGTDLSGDENLTVAIAQGSIGDRSYTANWTLIGYVITYDLNGGSLEAGETNPESYDITSANIELKNPVRAGYEFKGWSGSDLTGDANLTVTIAQGSSGNRAYVANWIPINYTITYNLNEGVLAAGDSNPTGYDIASADITLKNPGKDYYDFKGWSGTDLTGDTNTTVTISQGSIGNREYTANWIPTSYEIHYNLDGGNLAEGVTNPVSYDITSETITLNKPKRAGSIFRGWTGTGIEEGTASKTVTIPQGSIGERSYVASWTTLGDVLTFAIPGSLEVITMKRPTTTNDFYMGIYELTGSQYVAINGGSDPSMFPSLASHPVDSITWYEACDTCNRLNQKLGEAGTLPEGYEFRLPTLDEWTYVCNAGSTGSYGLGEGDTQITEANLSDYAVYGRGYMDGHGAVGSKKSNAWGYYDMHGNVWEWCSSTYDNGFSYEMGGGRWDSSAAECRSDDFGSSIPSMSILATGMRLYMAPVEE